MSPSISHQKTSHLRLRTVRRNFGAIEKTVGDRNAPKALLQQSLKPIKPTQNVSTPFSFKMVVEHETNRTFVFEMINFKRLPGILFRCKVELCFLLLIAGFIVYLVHRWGLVCTNREIKREIDRLCKLNKAGVAVGNLCKPLCESKEIHSISCISQHSKKQFVFTAKWNKRLIVIKSSRVTETQKTFPKTFNRRENTKKTLLKENLSKLFARSVKIKKKERRPKPIEDEDSSEKDFESAIRRIASEKLNVTLTHSQLNELKFLDWNNKFLQPIDLKREIERENVLSLLQSQEYLLLKLFSDRDIFPQVLGTCGHFYGVEYLERPNYSSLFTLDDKAEWSERMRLAVAIMDFVEEVETNLPDALYLCDVQMHHLGVTSNGRVKFLDLDLVYMKSIIDKILQSARKCRHHKDCDFLDCKSTCDFKENVCNAGIANDNLQTICEKIFIGWTISEKMIIPGLLMSEYTPASLSTLLRSCAENAREPVHEDLRQSLYMTLTEMHQILLQKLAAE